MDWIRLWTAFDVRRGIVPFPHLRPRRGIRRIRRAIPIGFAWAEWRGSDRIDAFCFGGSLWSAAENRRAKTPAPRYFSFPRVFVGGHNADARRHALRLQR